MQITLCVYDSKAKGFLEPIYVPTVAVGIRAFKVACNTADHDFHEFAEDYTLFETGTWDPATAKTVDLPTPKSLGLALHFIDEVLSNGPALNLVETRPPTNCAGEESDNPHAEDCRFFEGAESS